LRIPKKGEPKGCGTDVHSRGDMVLSEEKEIIACVRGAEKDQGCLKEKVNIEEDLMMASPTEVSETMLF